MSIKHETGGVISSNYDWLHYNEYNEIWSRVLIRSGRNQGFLQQVSIQLTPTKGWDDKKSIEEIQKCYIKVHEPAPSIYEKYTHLLPKSVYQRMTKAYGMPLRNFLLDKDILNYINFNKLIAGTEDTDKVEFSKCSVLEPYKKGLIERLIEHPELYDMPYALGRHINKNLKIGIRRL